jgi:hypothetical protein
MDQDAESSTFPVGALFQNADDFGTDAVDQSRWDFVSDSMNGDEVARERTAVSERALLGWAGEKSGLTIGYFSSFGESQALSETHKWPFMAPNRSI